ncbi:hypothetical protein ACJIZ3_004985 [Penstemon smallii]|uniref:RanBP2-type domain-containing protein n=1 Tax=Penstemon smallii TaxID=265156 RepID=A0ABD3S3L3_9LAMI
MHPPLKFHKCTLIKHTQSFSLSLSIYIYRPYIYIYIYLYIFYNYNRYIVFNPSSPKFCALRGRMNRPGDWNCRSCQHLNFQRRDSCQRCGDPRPGDNFGGGGGGFGGGRSSFGFTGPDVRPGDWYCSLSNCGAHNFASRSTCFKCGGLKEEAGGGFDTDMSRSRGFGFGGGLGLGGGGGGSRSGWKSGDWICVRLGCNEHNFASRMECFRCNAPRESSSKSAF